MAAMSRPLKAGKPSQVKYNERRSLATAVAPAGTQRGESAVGGRGKRQCIATTMAETGVEHEADATGVTTVVADGTLADGAGATSEASAAQLQAVQVNAQRRRPRRPAPAATHNTAARTAA